MQVKNLTYRVNFLMNPDDYTNMHSRYNNHIGHSDNLYNNIFIINNGIRRWLKNAPSPMFMS